MKSARTRITLLLPVALLLVTAPLAAQQVHYGKAAQIGDGHVRAYVMLDEQAHPLELGIAIDEAAFGSLPDLAEAPPEEAFVELDLLLPEENPTPYRYAMFHWNPRGHEPDGIYTVPHFDFHFYLTDPEARHAIVPTGTPEEFEARGMKAPEDGYLPAHYVNPGGTTVPMMGSHWIDPASHEFHGQPFDKTFIYGTWDGEVIFGEPMITKAYIESRGDETIEIALPSRFAAAGVHPSAYRVRYDAEAKEYRIALTGFETR